MRCLCTFMMACALAEAMGCASGPLSTLRFPNRDPVWLVADREPIPKPETYERGDLTSDVDAQLRRPMIEALSMPSPMRAQNVNSLGEVPDCSWFENRIGLHELTVEEIVRGPGEGPPDDTLPWIVTEATVTESGSRLVVEGPDRGSYILKFDEPGSPELETGPEVLVQRLLWAAGYNVPENHIVFVRRENLALPEDSEVTAGEIDAVLAAAAPDVRGRGYRALSSKYLSGVPVGGYPMRGVRADDPNDRVPHEHRRDVRGQKVFFAWLGQTDVKEANTLDMWVETDVRAKLGHLVHYVLDFGKALGTWAARGRHEHDGFSSHFDYGYALASLFSLGLWERPWEAIEWPTYRGLGRYEAAHFDPDDYAPANHYTPFTYTDRFDVYWAAKIISRFDQEHVAAAVEQARYSDPRTSAYLKRTIGQRRRAILRQAFSEVGPLDDFRVHREGGYFRFCARDLALASGVAQVRNTRYSLTSYGYDGTPLGYRRELYGTPGGALCAAGLRPDDGRSDGYVMLVLQLERGYTALPPVTVHLALDHRERALRVIGVERR